MNFQAQHFTEQVIDTYSNQKSNYYNYRLNGNPIKMAQLRLIKKFAVY